jgi:hypothetical protein
MRMLSSQQSSVTCDLAVTADVPTIRNINNEICGIRSCEYVDSSLVGYYTVQPGRPSYCILLHVH